MSKKKPEKPAAAPADDATLAGFRAVLARKKAAKAPPTGPMPSSGNVPKHLKPRPKDRIRRRP